MGWGLEERVEKLWNAEQEANAAAAAAAAASASSINVPVSTSAGQQAAVPTPSLHRDATIRAKGDDRISAQATPAVA